MKKKFVRKPKEVLKDVHFICGHITDIEKYSNMDTEALRKVMERSETCPSCRALEADRKKQLENIDIEYAKKQLADKGIEAFDLRFTHYGAAIEVCFFINLPKKEQA